MSRCTLAWQAEAIDDVIRLAMSLETRELKLLLDNIPLLVDDPRPNNADQRPDLPDMWELPIGARTVTYEIIADSTIAIRGIQTRA